MFYVVNKSKIYSYLIALCTVVILFVAATTINDMASPSGNLVETGANIMRNEVNNIVENQIHQNTTNNVIENQIGQNAGKNAVGNQVNSVKNDNHM